MDRTDVPLPSPATGMVARRCKDGGGEQLLVLSNDGFRPLEGGSHGQPYNVGALLPLRAADGQPYTPSGGTWRAVYEPLSGCVFFREGHALMRLGADNVVTLAAGHKTEQGTADGDGEAARFGACSPLATDGRGAIYLLDHGHASIRKLHVSSPPNRSAVLGGDDDDLTPDSCVPACTRIPFCFKPPSSTGFASGPAGSSGRGGVAVTTLPCGAAPGGSWTSLALGPTATGDDGRNGMGAFLLATTVTAVYRVPLGDLGAGAGAGCAVLQAGAQGQASRVDGAGAAARFSSITGAAADETGTTLLADNTAVRSMDAWGAVTTHPNVTFGSAQPCQLACLPGGSGGFAACGNAATALTLLLPKSQMHVFALEPGRWGGGGDAPRLGELLRSPTIGAALVTVGVGGEAFAAHRSVLCAGSEFFARMLEGGFAEGGAGPTEPVELKETHPGAFQALLEFFYTGRLDVPDALLRPTCELAGRLLLPPELQGWLQGRLLGRATPGTAIDDLIWADRHGMSELAAQLKERIVRHRALVKAGGFAQAALQRLAEHSPALVAELGARLL
ncbi:hypothetical protein HYH03_016421 [Edaphochlamys debaryana]|uniref:BTB domain-containing protein n=1 Tax=Edaphochlamys debaryana TaxID=47281 RepID=A0A836BQ97_9CHLO|nr:hypothetical protein HYH03_016421 [Edaphochlamys debaryana]|eukprot:KAG2484767.1 hypothetical protein HYH03_016421 [Edaphochlamys debaryana]